MWSRLYKLLLGFTLSSLIHVSQCQDYECDHEMWDEATEGRGVKKLKVQQCASGHIEWHGPYGGLFLEIKGPAKEYRLCIQAYSVHTSAVISFIDNEGSSPSKLLVLEQRPKDKVQQKQTMCIPANEDMQLFIEPDISSYVSSKIVIDYDVEANPRYNDDACRPCTDEELLEQYCSSDFVAIGRMLDVSFTSSANIITVSLDLVKRQSAMLFTKSDNKKTYLGQLYTPSNCKMEYGPGKFIFMGRIRFKKAELRCGPTYDDFLELQRTSKLKGKMLCT